MPDFITDKITSRQNLLVTRLSKLSDKKFRDTEGLFRIDGFKLFAEARRSALEIEYVFVTDAAAEKLKDLIVGCKNVYSVTDEVLAKLTDEKSPEGIVAVARKFTTEPENAPLGENLRALILSSISDPGNFGTIVRTAYALGIDRVYIGGDCADLYSPKTIRASMGMIFRQKLAVVCDEIEFITKLKADGCSVYAAALRENALRLGSFKLDGKVCVAVGNESHGLSNELIEACSGTLLIPMNPGCESLNAAAAAGVICWEMCKERL